MKKILLTLLPILMFFSCNSIPSAYSGQEISSEERAMIWMPSTYKEVINGKKISIYSTTAYIPPGTNHAYMDKNSNVDSLTNQITTYSWDINFEALPGHVYYFYTEWIVKYQTYALFGRDLGTDFVPPPSPVLFASSSYNQTLEEMKQEGTKVDFTVNRD